MQPFKNASGLCANVLPILLLASCASLPPRGIMEVSKAIEPSTDTRLARGIVPLTAVHPGMSGIYPLAHGKDALASRLLLTEAADRSLDVQYYIWHRDTAGILLMDQLRKAANRGVRVRLLLDDNGIAGMDPLLAELDAMDNAEVRIINPFANRSARWLGYLTDFRRLNHRMHNKSMTADGQASIVGGRNIGNEYFAAGQDVSFADLDVVAVGPAARDVSRAFDDYWNSDAAYPARILIKPAQQPVIAAAAAAARADAQATDYLNALRKTRVVDDLLRGSLSFQWALTSVVHDDPQKLLGVKTGDAGLVLGQLAALGGEPQRKFLLVSPYFVPMAGGTKSLVAMAQRGVEVTVLTNSLNATDVSAVHAGYAKRRRDLLEGGVRLFELKRNADSVERKQKGPSSGASLHAKTFAIDGEMLFVGSFNFDPRSAALNTEMGLMIRSPALAAQLAHLFRDTVPEAAYEVRLATDGSLEWLDRSPASEVRYTAEPEAGLMRRMSAAIARWLPIEGLL